MEVGEGGGRLYTYRYTVTTRMAPALTRISSDESHFNVSLIVMDRRLSTNHNLFKQKREPKRNRTEALLLSQTGSET